MRRQQPQFVIRGYQFFECWLFHRLIQEGMDPCTKNGFIRCTECTRYTYDADLPKWIRGLWRWWNGRRRTNRN